MSNSLSLTHKRAKFVYEAARLAAMAAGVPIVPDPLEEREDAFVKQFLEVIEKQCGPDRSDSPEDLHNEWIWAYLRMGWLYGKEYSREKRRHPDLVDYDDLGKLEQDKDSVFVALCEIARLWIYE